jgi:hypothetical protein
MARKESILIKILIFLFIIQRIRATEGKRELRRLNPYNPLSYIFIAGVILLYGAILAWKEYGKEKPFKWH